MLKLGLGRGPIYLRRLWEGDYETAPGGGISTKIGKKKKDAYLSVFSATLAWKSMTAARKKLSAAAWCASVLVYK